MKLGAGIIQVYREGCLKQGQLAEAPSISQQQMASFVVRRREAPISALALPKLKQRLAMQVLDTLLAQASA